jgi:hypothetical protein
VGLGADDVGGDRGPLVDPLVAPDPEADHDVVRVDVGRDDRRRLLEAAAEVVDVDVLGLAQLHDPGAVDPEVRVVAAH